MFAPLTFRASSFFRIAVVVFASTTGLYAQTTYATPYAFTTLAGGGGRSANVDGLGAAARFASPFASAVDAAGNVYIADIVSHTIRRITPAGAVTTLAGSPGNPGSADGTGTIAQFNTPNGLAVDAAGNLYVADNGNHTIRRLTPAGVVTTIAGTAGAAGATDGTGAAARFWFPAAVALDAAGNVFVCDSFNSTIRRITPTGVVTTFAGSAGVAGAVDGIGGAAGLISPWVLRSTPAETSSWRTLAATSSAASLPPPSSRRLRAQRDSPARPMR